ncbi:NADH:ubiquinone oxidoreductase [Knufia fluminis]|uniref:NADH:ubiquinone oxidoreductase n=1 Tax=Knufia fluminis TaxID=191047 RepID=A0AAN8E8F5_9EURO|nr:NADH:ubiquinone oxidoreductase [Knufia fluminis]
MPGSERSMPSSPAPGASPEESLKFYKTQYEFLEAELADFQASSKDLEAELERDIEQAEKRERKLKEQAEDLRYQVDEWKEKHKQAKSEAGAAQASLEREVKTLRQENLTLRQQLRDIEVANDDFERKQRTTEVSLEDMESKANQAIERAVILEEEVKIGEQERESLRIETQRLKDEFSDYRVETEIVRKKLEKAEEVLATKRRSLTISPNVVAASPRSELSPTTTEASAPSFDTPPAKAATSSSVSDTPTPPSPSASEKVPATPQPFATPVAPKSRLSIASTNATPRQPPLSARVNGHARGSSIAISSRTQGGTAVRQSFGKGGIPTRQSNIPSGLPKSSSILQLRNLRGKMQNLEERVHKARSKLPAPTDTPPRGSPRSGSALSNHIPASVTMRSSRKKGTGSILSGQDLDEVPATPSLQRPRSSRQSAGRPGSPTRTSMAAPPRPSSRTSAVSNRASMSHYQPGHSRPTSRASTSGLRSLANGNSYAPNASTDRVRPHSSLSSHGGGYDGAFDEDLEDSSMDMSGATPRRSTYAKRTSDVGTSIPTSGAVKRTSLGGSSRLPALTRRQSSGIPFAEGRPPSRSTLGGVKEGNQGDDNETF